MTELQLPLVIEIEPTLTCNLRCRMCHVSFMPDEPRPVMTAQLLGQLPRMEGSHFIIGSNFEPMMAKDFPDIVRRITDMGAALELVTNGTLMNEQNLDALLEANVMMLNFSFDGIRKDTYEHIRRRADHASTLANIAATRKAFEGRRTVFGVNSTMMLSNLDEIQEMVAYWDDANFDILRLLTMVVRDNNVELIKQNLYPYRERYYNLLDRAAEEVIQSQRGLMLRTPYYAKSPLRSVYPENFVGDEVMSARSRIRRDPKPRIDYQVGAGPGMTFPCKSPWTFARITAGGDVELCFKFTVGNLHDQSFEDIWYGERANHVRKIVAEEAKHCSTCDYWRLCLNSVTLDPDHPESHFAGPLLDGVDSIDFETGTMAFEVHEPPRLVESIGAVNIVYLRGQYVGLPQALGPINLEITPLAGLEGVEIADTLAEIRKRVRASQRSVTPA